MQCNHHPSSRFLRGFLFLSLAKSAIGKGLKSVGTLFPETASLMATTSLEEIDVYPIQTRGDKHAMQPPLSLLAVYVTKAIEQHH